MKYGIRTVLAMLVVSLSLTLVGIGCKNDGEKIEFPPRKPPVPGINQSPAIDALSP